MIDTSTYGQIRNCHRDGLTQRATAKKLGIARRTVAKYWNGAHIAGMKEPREPQESDSKAEIKAAMKKYFEDHISDQTRKQKINGKILWRDLHFKYPRSPTTYRRYWAEIRGEWQTQTRLLLKYGKGEMAQMDWKQVTVRIQGQRIILHVFCFNMMYGYSPFKKAYINEKQYNLIDGFVSAMEFFGGSVRRILVDNMVTARKSGYGVNAKLTDEFERLSAHYGFEVLFANPNEPSEKGGIENAADTTGDIMTPIRDFNSISEVNDLLLRECVHYIEHAGRIGTRPGTVKEMTEEERPSLIQLPYKRYELGIYAEAVANNQQILNYDKSQYSVPRLYAGKRISIIAYSYRVEMYVHRHKIWECDRPLLEGESRIYAEHYKFDLEIKARAYENALPLLEGILPLPELHRFRDLCKAKSTKCYQLYMLMQKMETVGKDQMIKALEIANATGHPTYDMVANLLLLSSSPKEDDLDQAILQDEFFVQTGDPKEYDILLEPR